MTRLGNVLAVAVVSTAVVAACSSDESAPATTDVIPTVAESMPVTATTPSTTTPSTTTTTTVAPTTTLDPTDALAAEVEADFLEADRLAREASQDPFEADKEAAAMKRRLGVMADEFSASLASYRSSNYAIRPNPTTPASVTVEVPASLVRDGADVAQVQICEVNSWILVEVGAGPNNSDAIVNSDVIATRAVVYLRDDGGLWRIEGANEVGRWEGLSACPAG